MRSTVLVVVGNAEVEMRGLVQHALVRTGAVVFALVDHRADIEIFMVGGKVELDGLGRGNRGGVKLPVVAPGVLAVSRRGHDDRLAPLGVADVSVQDDDALQRRRDVPHIGVHNF